ncbi:MAG: hypothetical protein IIW34_00230, partial [Clostridia bacterium]|nr:hypothetical protein [Clostridia bacterium]
MGKIKSQYGETFLLFFRLKTKLKIMLYTTLFILNLKYPTIKTIRITKVRIIRNILSPFPLIPYIIAEPINKIKNIT